MKFLGRMLLILGALFLGSAESREVEKALDAFNGTWDAVSVVAEGKPDAWAVANSTIAFKGNLFDSLVAQDANSGHFGVNFGVKPAQIDLSFDEGNASGKTRHGIFRLARDDLYMAMPTTTGERPATLESSKGCHCVVLHLVRRSPGASRPSFVERVTPLADGSKEVVVFAEFRVESLGNNSVQSVDLKSLFQKAASVECSGRPFTASPEGDGGITPGNGPLRLSLKGNVRCS